VNALSKFFYNKLAFNNIKRNSKAYVPYILTCIGTIMMFYNMVFLSVVDEFGYVSGSRSLRIILRMGTVVVGIFSVIFLFYTNSFLIKQRKKEFGLFNVLGMEKKHIARVMLCETLMIGILSIVTGLFLGILFSKLMILLLLKIISFKINIGFEVPTEAVIATLILFIGIFAVNLAYNLIQVYRTKLVELLASAHLGEKEPKTKWLMTIIGVICLVAGYYIAVTTEAPLEALHLFFIAVIFVIIGTYCLFTAGSIALLKMLKKNKKYYYKANHFTAVSGMIYRMKQNAVGLANICILSTAVIVMLSTTFSLYIGMEDVLRFRYPRDIIIIAKNVSEEQMQKMNELIETHVEKSGVIQKNTMYYRSMDFVVLKKGTEYIADYKSTYNTNDIANFFFITQDDYNRIKNTSVSLEDNELLLFVMRGKIPGDKISFNGLEMSIKERLSSFITVDRTTSVLAQDYYAVVKDVEAIKRVHNALFGEGDMGELSYWYGFDTDEDKDAEIQLAVSLWDSVKQVFKDVYLEGPELEREAFYTLYGGLFYLGIFLGLLFIMATVLIIYYKQLAEGIDDRNRFIIMQKVGMSHSEVKKSIRSQVLTVFFLPIGAAVVHLAFAFKVITKLLMIFNLNNVALYAGCTLLTIFAFVVFYAIVYALTSRTYYRIISA